MIDIALLSVIRRWHKREGIAIRDIARRTDFKDVTEEQIKFVMNRLNSRPRKTQNYQSPNELFLGQPVDFLVA